MPRPSPSRSLAWSLGAFVGEIARAIRTPVEPASRRRVEVDRRTETRREGGMILRRTTIDEVELPAEGGTPRDRD